MRGKYWVAEPFCTSKSHNLFFYSASSGIGIDWIREINKQLGLLPTFTSSVYLCRSYFVRPVCTFLILSRELFGITELMICIRLPDISTLQLRATHFPSSQGLCRFLFCCFSSSHYSFETRSSPCMRTINHPSIDAFWQESPALSPLSAIKQKIICIFKVLYALTEN